MNSFWTSQLLIGLLFIIETTFTAEIFLPSSLYDEENLREEFDNHRYLYDGCGTSRKLCSGIGVSDTINCIDTKSCNYAGFITENTTHFHIDALEHHFTTNRAVVIAFGFGIHKIQDNPFGGRESPFQCKSDISLHDFRIFLLLNETDVRNQPTRSPGDKTSTTVDKFAWMKKCHNDVRLLNKRAKHFEDPKSQMQVLVLGHDIISPLFVSHDGNADLRGNEYILTETRPLYSTVDGIFYSNVRQIIVADRRK